MHFDVQRQSVCRFLHSAAVVSADIQDTINVNSVLGEINIWENVEYLLCRPEIPVLTDLDLSCSQIVEHVRGATTSPQAARTGKVCLYLIDADGSVMHG